ncbi:MAG TPA: caspase family protein, partial [Acidobacteriota bacterium]
QFGTEWLVATPEGLFDGSPPAWGQILWRFSQNTFDVAPVETFFNEYYYPGLLAEIFSGKPPQAPRDVTQLDRRQPQVKLLTAGDGSARDATVKVEITEAQPDSAHPTGSGARDVRLFRNGSLVKVWRGDALQGKNQAILEAQVPIVAGENRFIAYAFNHDNVKSPDAEMKVNGAESLRRAGTAYVLSIGVNEYENSDFNLKYAVSDARAFSENLSQAQTKLGKFGKVELIHMFDREATKPNIVAALQKLAGAEPEDAIFLYFAGHGTTDGSRFYMVPHDLGYHNPRSNLNDSAMRSIMNHSISDVELEELFEKIGAGQTLLVIDACNSGQLLEAEEKRRGPMNSRGLAQLAYEKGMYILAASQGYQAALEASKLGHGYLTYSLVEEGIKSFSADNLPKDGTVLVREWFDYA